jgi:arsenate reductase
LRVPALSQNAAVIILYGIPNCDTVKKARAWLAERGAPHQFHDFKKQGIPPERLDAWFAQVGWETLLNRKGTTWRKLDTAAQNGAQDAAGARALMLAHPSVIKRPVRNGVGRPQLGSMQRNGRCSQAAESPTFTVALPEKPRPGRDSA